MPRENQRRSPVRLRGSAWWRRRFEMTTGRNAHPCGSGLIKTFAVVGQAFRIHADFTDFGKVGAYTNCARDSRIGNITIQVPGSGVWLRADRVNSEARPHESLQTREFKMDRMTHH